MGSDKIKAFLGGDTVFRGDLFFRGTVHIDGEFTGKIHTEEGRLELGPQAKVHAQVNVSELTVSGYLDGEINVTKKTTLYKTAQVHGSIASARLIMEEGALLHGKVKMSNSDEPEQAAIDVQAKAALSAGEK